MNETLLNLFLISCCYRTLVRNAALVVSFVMFAAVAEAQQPTKIPRIGYLAAGFLSANAARIEALQQGLQVLGYLEGKNIVIEYRFAEGKLAFAPQQI